MMKKFFVGIVLIVPFVAVAQTKSAAKKTPASGTKSIAASVERGKTVYITNCLACHQADGSGVPRLNPPVVNNEWVLGDKKRLIQLMLNGSNGRVEIDGEKFHNNMPAQKHLTDQQIADVLTYVRNSFGNKASAVSAAEVKALRPKE